MSRQGGFTVEASRRFYETLWDMGWRVAPAFDEDCAECGGSGDDLGEQCRCGGLKWFPPGEVTPRV